MDHLNKNKIFRKKRVKPIKNYIKNLKSIDKLQKNVKI
jgi:hypothetical protein